MTNGIQMKFSRKIFIWILRLALASLLLMSLFMGGVYWFLQRNPQETARSYLSQFSKESGLEFSFGGIDVMLFPVPSLAITDLSIRGGNLDFTAAWLSARPNLLLLLGGDVFPGKISMLRPKLKLRTDLPLADPLELGRHLGADNSGANKKKKNSRPDPGKFLLGDCDVEVMQGEAVIDGDNNSAMAINALQCAITLEKDVSIRGSLQLAALRTHEGGKTIFNLEDLRVSGNFNPLHFLIDTPDFKTSGRVRYANYIHEGSFDVDFHGASPGWDGKFDIRADLRADNDILPLALRGNLAATGRGGPIFFRSMQWNLGADSGSLEARLDPGAGFRNFKMDGIFRANRLSLTEWLGFARNLPPGLQLSLDNILDARLEFALTPTGLQAPKISARCVGSYFTGKGSVADFSRPVVALDLKTKSANLGLAIPESLGVTPQPAYFAHAPFTPIQASPHRPGDIGIDYDIRLAADTIKYGYVKIRKGSLRIYPGKMDKSGYEDVLLSGKGIFYGGSVSGDCILGADQSLPYSITAEARDINGSQLAKDLPLMPLGQGILKGKVNITSKSKKLDVFLANLRGTVEASAEKAKFRGMDSKEVFPSLSARIALKGGSLERNSLGMNGQWQAVLKAGAYEGNGELNGKLWFGGHKGEMSFTELPGDISFTLLEGMGPLPKNSKGKLRGKLSARSREGEFSVKDGSYEFLGISGKIAASLESGKGQTRWKGNFSGATEDINALLVRLGAKPGFLPQAYRKCSINSAFSGNANSLQLTSIKARAGQTQIGGKFSCSKKNSKPFLDFALTADNLDMTAFGDSAKSGKQVKNSWNFENMRAFNARGDLGVNSLKGWNVSVQKAKIPLTLDNGKLSFGPGSGRLYGAPLHFRGNVNFGRGIAFNGTMSAHDFDLGAASREFKLQSVLTGKANLDASIRAKMTGPGQLLSALNGEWSFSIRNGNWQGMKKGKLTGKPTKFSLASGSGVISNGICRSANFNLRADNMIVTGGGWINLPQNKMDCDFNVSMKGLPDIPLRLYGNLDNTKTSIGAGKLVINAISGITTGVVDVLGGIVEGAWKIFR